VGTGVGTFTRREPSSESSSTPALELRHVSKTFAGAKVLDNIDLMVRPGEVHVLAGHNGSGKSTLIKILAGVHRPDPGGIILSQGREISHRLLGDPSAEMQFVHQDLGIIPELSARDNIGLTLGYDRRRFGRIAWREHTRRCEEILGRIGVTLDVERPLLGAGKLAWTAVAMARALYGLVPGQGVLVLDELTATLSASHVADFLEIVRTAADDGASVLYVSHRMEEVFDIGDSMTVLRSGKVVYRGLVNELTKRELANWIAGEEIAESGEWENAASEETVLEVRSLNTHQVRDVSLEIKAGEIVGVAGVEGSGRDALPYALVGSVEKGDFLQGEWYVKGQQIPRPTTLSAWANGIAFVPGDRLSEGIIPGMTGTQNLGLVSLPKVTKRGWISRRRERAFDQTWLSSIEMERSVAERPIETLSGGQQQKVVLGRALSVEPAVLIMAEPTAGMDPGARAWLYSRVRQMAKEGVGVLVSTSDVEDLVSICDRVIVFDKARISEVFERRDIDRARIVAAMVS